MTTPLLDFVNHLGQNQPWHWRVVATNGKILCHSENYTRYADCAHAASVALRLGVEPKLWHSVAMGQEDLSARVYNIRHFTIEDD